MDIEEWLALPNEPLGSDGGGNPKVEKEPSQPAVQTRQVPVQVEPVEQVEQTEQRIPVQTSQPVQSTNESVDMDTWLALPNEPVGSDTEDQPITGKDVVDNVRSFGNYMKDTATGTAAAAKRGWYDMAAGIEGNLATVTDDLAGLGVPYMDEAADYLEDSARRTRAHAGEQYQPQVQSYKDIDSFSDLDTFLGERFAMAIPGLSTYANPAVGITLNAVSNGGQLALDDDFSDQITTGDMVFKGVQSALLDLAGMKSMKGFQWAVESPITKGVDTIISGLNKVSTAANKTPVTKVADTMISGLNKVSTSVPAKIANTGRVIATAPVASGVDQITSNYLLGDDLTTNLDEAVVSGTLTGVLPYGMSKVAQGLDTDTWETPKVRELAQDRLTNLNNEYTAQSNRWAYNELLRDLNKLSSNEPVTNASFSKMINEKNNSLDEQEQYWYRGAVNEAIDNGLITDNGIDTEVMAVFKDKLDEDTDSIRKSSQAQNTVGALNILADTLTSEDYGRPVVDPLTGEMTTVGDYLQLSGITKGLSTAGDIASKLAPGRDPQKLKMKAVDKAKSTLSGNIDIRLLQLEDSINSATGDNLKSLQTQKRALKKLQRNLDEYVDGRSLTDRDIQNLSEVSRQINKSASEKNGQATQSFITQLEELKLANDIAKKTSKKDQAIGAIGLASSYATTGWLGPLLQGTAMLAGKGVRGVSRGVQKKNLKRQGGSSIDQANAALRDLLSDAQEERAKYLEKLKDNLSLKERNELLKQVKLLTERISKLQASGDQIVEDQ